MPVGHPVPRTKRDGCRRDQDEYHIVPAKKDTGIRQATSEHFRVRRYVVLWHVFGNGYEFGLSVAWGFPGCPVLLACNLFENAQDLIEGILDLVQLLYGVQLVELFVYGIDLPLKPDVPPAEKHANRQAQ